MKPFYFFIGIAIVSGIGIFILIDKKIFPVFHTTKSGFNQFVLPSPQTNIKSYQKRNIRLGKAQVTVDIADTPEKMVKGLSGREALSEGTGMLFIYSSPQAVAFWMPDMNFPIDIIYLRNKKVSSFYENVPNPPKDTPRNQLPLYPSVEPITMVLEVPAGWVDKHDIVKGSELEFTD